MGRKASIPRPGEVFQEKYRVLRTVGEGGMGVVFAAHHMLLDQHVAIKLLPVEVGNDGESVARLVNEARLAARIKSEHVCQVLDVGQAKDGRPFLVMELLQGHDLASLLRTRGPLPPHEVVDWLLQAMEGLAHAHARDIVHRDLKPSNLFLAHQIGAPPIVKILDFGISKGETPLANGMTSTQAILGSPAYMSPEQIKDARTVDARSDIWSLGVIMYELFTGVCPFDGTTAGAIFARILDDSTKPTAIRASLRDFPAALEEVVDRCLQGNREDRYASVLELARALQTFASTPQVGATAVERIRGAFERARPSTWNESSGRIHAFDGHHQGPSPHPTNVSWTSGTSTHPGVGRSVVVGVVAAIGLAVVAGGVLLTMSRVRAKHASAAAEANTHEMPPPVDVGQPATSALAPAPPPVPAAAPTPPAAVATVVTNDAPAVAVVDPTAAPVASSAPPVKPIVTRTQAQVPATPRSLKTNKQDILKERR